VSVPQATSGNDVGPYWQDQSTSSLKGHGREHSEVLTEQNSGAHPTYTLRQYHTAAKSWNATAARCMGSAGVVVWRQAGGR